jgi:hypothetical protein
MSMRYFWSGIAVMVVGCGSVDSKQVDARMADTGSGSASDASIDTPATCAATPSMAKARYRAENNANDHLGNFNGTAVGANFSYAAGKYGQGFQLDGTDDAVTINDGDQMWPAGSLTIEAWIKTTSTRPTSMIVSKYACGNACPSGSSLAYFGLYTDATGHPGIDFRPDGTQDITSLIASTVAVNDGMWHHIVGVRDATAMTASVYVDGALAASASPVAAQFGAMTNADNDVDLVTIGASVVAGMTTYTSLYPGVIDEVAIYHSALTAAQVSAIYSAPQGKCL